MVSLLFPFLLKALGVAVFLLLLVFLLPVYFLKALKVGTSRPSLHVYRKNLPSNNIWLSVSNYFRLSV